MAAIYFRNKNGKFVELPIGGVSDSQIEESVKKYLEENPVEFIERDPTVPDWAKQPNKPTYTADEVGTYSTEDIHVMHTALNNGIATVDSKVVNIEKVVSRKADKSTTYTKTEVDNLIIDVNAKVEEVEAVAKGRATGYVFDTVDDMNHWLEDSANTAKLVLGDNLYIKATDVPDYWWDGVQEQPLETQKVDLTEYAKKGTTLSEYSIVDAYTKNEVDNEISKIAEEIVELGESQQSIAKKMEETILYEEVVNTSEWDNQPTFDGALDSAFNTTDFYYVTLKDADGTSLENGYFKLMSNIDGYGSAYSTLFYLENYDTGNSDVLTENRPIEFVEISENVKMRVAGVHDVSWNTNWLLNGNKGKIIISSDGQFIPIAKSGYWYPFFRTTKRVSYWHSVDTAAMNPDSTFDIFPYAPMSVGEYTKNKFYDECILERLSDTRYVTKRSVTLRYMKKGSTGYAVVSYMPIGHGEILNGETFISKISLSQAGNHKGLIRNGTVIRVTEVK